MKKVCILIFAIAFFLFFGRSEILACSCVPQTYGETLETKVNKAKAGSKAVFTGTVLSVVEDSENGIKTVKLKILKSWKGNFSKEITIVTGWDDGDCGYNFKVGKTYLVYAFMSGMYTPDNRLMTNICSRTTNAEDANNEIKVLNKKKKLLNDKSVVFFKQNLQPKNVLG